MAVAVYLLCMLTSAFCATFTSAATASGDWRSGSVMARGFRASRSQALNANSVISAA